MVEVSSLHPEMQNRTIGQGGTGISFDNTHLLHRHLSASCEEDDRGCVGDWLARLLRAYCNRAERASAQRTEDLLSHTEKPLNKRNFRTHKDRLERKSANS
jgi:hypothetical protein